MLDEVDLQADGDKEQGGEEVGDELVHDLPRLFPQIGGIADGQAGEKGPEDGMDVDVFGEGGGEQAKPETEGEDTARPGKTRLDPGQDEVDDKASGHQHEDGKGDNRGNAARERRRRRCPRRPARG